MKQSGGIYPELRSGIRAWDLKERRGRLMTKTCFSVDICPATWIDFSGRKVISHNITAPQLEVVHMLGIVPWGGLFSNILHPLDAYY